MSRLRIICSGGGSHGEIVATEIDVVDGAVTEVLVRRGRSPVSGKGSGVVDGVTVPVELGSRAVVSTQPVIGANGTLHWKCPKCRRDRPVAGDKLTAWAALAISRGRVALDLSALPR